MIQAQKGEVTVDLNGTSYTLALTLNAMVVLEDTFHLTFDEVTQKAMSGSMKHFRAFFWVLFQKHHPEITLEQAGAMVTLHKLQEVSTRILSDAVKASQPDPTDVQEVTGGKGKSANPTKARANGVGTGASSTSRLDTSA